MHKKLIAPAIITILLIAVLIVYLCLWMIVPIPIAFKVVCALVLFTLMGVSVFVMVERIKEIRSGEEDDLSKY